MSDTGGRPAGWRQRWPGCSADGCERQEVLHDAGRPLKLTCKPQQAEQAQAGQLCQRVVVQLM
jgi:hypothetical protein